MLLPGEVDAAQFRGILRCRARLCCLQSTQGCTWHLYPCTSLQHTCATIRVNRQLALTRARSELYVASVCLHFPRGLVRDSCGAFMSTSLQEHLLLQHTAGKQAPSRCKPKACLCREWNVKQRNPMQHNATLLGIPRHARETYTHNICANHTHQHYVLLLLLLLLSFLAAAPAAAAASFGAALRSS